MLAEKRSVILLLPLSDQPLGHETADCENDNRARQADHQRGLGLGDVVAAVLVQTAQQIGLEADVASAKHALDLASSKVDGAQAKVSSAQKRVDEASDTYNTAQKSYDAAASEVASIQAKFDRLLDSLDASSLTALREAIRLDVGDVNHLHKEIEADDKKHDLAPTKAVEDVIADALDRLDGKMVDEVANRHLDHI